MRALAREAFLIAAVAATFVAPSSAQKPRTPEKPTGSISGRVTLGDEPAAGVTVVLLPSRGPYDRPAAKATTDQDGRYQLNGVPAGQYQLQSLTPAFVSGDDLRLRPGKTIDLSDGETVDQVDMRLTRGGVITGRVIDADGRPLIQESVRLMFLDDRGQRFPAYLLDASLFSTDDRGVYRIFGIPAGRYILSVGVDTRNGFFRTGGNTYPLTYYPDVTAVWKATVVEVTAEGEATGIDITVGRRVKSYRVTGHIIDADSGKPVPGMNYGFGTLQPNGTSFQLSTIVGSVSNARGEFRLEGVIPGRYSAFAASRNESEFYSDVVPFEVTDDDVDGIEIRVHRGSSVSGVVVIEDGDAPDALKLSEVRLGAATESRLPTPPSNSPVTLGTGGSFRAAGLKPGKLAFFLATYPAPKGAEVLRVERDGVEQPEGIDLREGEHLGGVRVVIGYGTGVIRGQVSVEGAVLPETARIGVHCRRLGGDNSIRVMNQAFPDSRGRFTLGWLAPGDYEVTATVGVMSGGPPPFYAKPVSQTVSIARGAQVQVNLVIEVIKRNQ